MEAVASDGWGSLTPVPTQGYLQYALSHPGFLTEGMVELFSTKSIAPPPKSPYVGPCLSKPLKVAGTWLSL